MSKPGKRRRTKLNDVNYSEAKKAFEKLGFMFARQSGSHIIMVKQGHPFHVCLPAHRPVKEGTLKQCIRAAGISPEEFADLLE